MKLIQCQKGHYYDSSKFEECPYCENVQKNIGVTVPLGRSMEEPEVEKQQRVSAKQADISPEPVYVQHQETSVSDQYEAQSQSSVSQQWRAPQQVSGRQEFWQIPEEDNRTVSYYSKKIGIEPVVGWLVAISGEYMGESFKIKGGRNFIGRSPEMDIQLGMDLSVSRRKHAVLIYEPKSRQFIAQPGESRELFYLNEEVVLNNVIMKAYDVLTIGETKLLLVPLCGEKFSWDDLKE